MKTVKLKNKEYRVCETIEDINIKRYIACKEQMIMVESGMDLPSLKDLYISWVRAFDNESKSGMLLKLHDHVRGLSKLESGVDPYQMIYALMVIEDKDEDQTVTDETYLQERLERLANAGLDQGQAQNDAKAFTVALFGQ